MFILCHEKLPELFYDFGDTTVQQKLNFFGVLDEYEELKLLFNFIERKGC